MNELDELLRVTIESKNILINRRNQFYNSIREMDLENDLISQIDIELINYFKNILSNLNLTEDEKNKIDIAFNYFSNVNSLNIDLNDLLFEDNQLLNLKKCIIMLYKKSLEYKENILNNYDTEINKKTNIIDSINKLKIVFESDEIDLLYVHSLLTSLPLKDQVKVNIYKEFYKKYVSKLPEVNDISEEEVTDIFSELSDQSELEIDKKIEEEGIKLEVNDSDRELQDKITLLHSNILKLKTKLPTNEEMSNKTVEEIDKISEDRAKYSLLLDMISKILEDLRRYFNDKDTKWDSGYAKEDIEELLNTSYNDLLDGYNECLDIYKYLSNKYGNVYREIEEDLSQLETIETEPNPIIFFVNGIQRFIEGNGNDIPPSLADELDKNKLFMKKIKSVLTDLKKKDFSKFVTASIDSCSHKFREIKVENRTKNNLAIRIYYDFFKDSKGNSYPVVFMIHAKDEDKDTIAYENVSRMIGSPIFEKLMQSLPNERVLERVKDLEKLVNDQIETLIADKTLKSGSPK